MRIDFTPDPGLFPFQSRFYESSVGRVHYIDEGSGVPILLLHGNPTWSFLYRKIVPRLQDSFRCIAVDYPGFGHSDRPDGYGYTPGEHARVIGELVDNQAGSTESQGRVFGQRGRRATRRLPLHPGGRSRNDRRSDSQALRVRTPGASSSVLGEGPIRA